METTLVRVKSSDEQSSASEHSIQDQKEFKHRMENYKWLFNAELSDGQIKVGTEVIPIHRVILSSKSQALDAVFVTQGASSITINNHSVRAVKTCIEFIYTDYYVMHDMADIPAVLELAIFFKLPDLRMSVCEAVAKWVDSGELSVNNCLDTHLMATNCKMDRKIVDAIQRFNSANKMEILRHELTEYKSVERVRTAIQVLSAKQRDVIEALSSGGMASSGRSHQDFERFIDLKKCSTRDLLKLNGLRLFQTNNLVAILGSKLNKIIEMIGFD